MIASSTASLVIAAKNVAKDCGDQQGVNQLISLVTQCALSASQLISCTKVCASTLNSRECQDQIVDAARLVSRNVDSVVDSANTCCQNDDLLNELNKCAQSVHEIVDQMVESARGSALANDSIDSKHDESVDRIFNATDCLYNSIGDTNEMMKLARVLAQATTELVNSLKAEASVQSTSEQQKRLLNAAKLLAESTSRIVEAAKGCAANPQDTHLQNVLLKAVEDLRAATTAATGENLHLKLIKKLSNAAKQAASCATQTIAAVQVCAVQLTESNSNATHQQLIEQCKSVADYVPKIVQGIRNCIATPEARSAHLGLMHACDDFVMPAQMMIGLCKVVSPTIVDDIKAIQLRNCTNQLSNALADLRGSLSRVRETCGFFEADAMAETIRHLVHDIVQLKDSSNLKPLPGETVIIKLNSLINN